MQAGATVADDGVVAIGLNNRNIVINNGMVLAGSVFGTTAIGVHNRSTIINNGTVNVVSDGNGLFADNNSAIVNNGSITGGDNVFAITVRNNTTVVNAGTIALGGFGATGIDLNNDSTNVTNAGSITAGVFSIGINSRNNNVITNSGSIAVGDTSFGINVRDGNTVTNSGTITVGDFGAAGIQARDDSPMILNSGAIIAGGGSPGIVVRDNNVVMNNGSITVANDPIGIGAAILARRNNTITNNGTIVAGDSNGSISNFGIGVGLFARNTFINNGTVVAGAFGLSLAPAPGGPANANTVINNGTLDGLIFLPSSFAPGASNFVTNSGLITITNPNTPFAPHTIDGTYTQTATGTLALRFSSNNALSNYDILRVEANNGADKIALDGTLRVVIQGTGFRDTLTYLNVLSCIECAPAIDGTFARVVTSSPFIIATATYNFDSVDITLQRQGFNTLPGLTPNQRAVATGLESAYSPNLVGNAARFYSGLFGATSISVLDQLSGEGTTALQSASLNVGSLFNSAMQNQALNGEFSGATTVTIPPAQFARTPRPRGQEAFASLKKEPEAPADQTGRWRIWTLGFGAYRTLDGSASVGSASQTIRNYGGALGFDHQLAPDLLLGFSAGGSDSSVSVPGLTTTGQITAGHLGIYGVKTWGPLYGAAAVSYARLDNSTTRTVTGVGPAETVRGQFASDQLGARLELGWKRAFAHYTLTPFVAIEPAALWAHGYQESSTTNAGGILGLAFAARTTVSVPTFVGLQADTRMVLRNGAVFTPYARLSWVHEFLPDRSITARFINLPASTFSVEGARPASDAARLDAGAKYAIDARRSLFANVSGEWSGLGHSYAATGGFRIVR